MPIAPVRVAIRSEPDVTRALLEATRLARELGFSSLESQAIATAVSELARNIIKYADSGDAVFAAIERGGDRGLQVTVRDRGPGIADTEAALRDHYSSGGTLGLGLPGVRRLMHEFELESQPGAGTTVVIRHWRRSSSRRSADGAAGQTPLARGRSIPSSVDVAELGIETGTFLRPCRGERVAGDAIYVAGRQGLVLLAIIDALGHGRSAHTVAEAAVRQLTRSWSADVSRTLLGLHEALTGTVGAAVGLCILRPKERLLDYAGVGNTVLRAVGDHERWLAASPGTLGHQLRSSAAQSLTLAEGDVLLMYTDGVKERFELTAYPQLRYQSAPLIARTVVERFGKDHDDAACLAVRVAA